MDKNLLENAGASVKKYTQSLRLHLKDPLYHNSYFLMANTVVTSALGFFFWIVIARFYTEKEVGIGSAIISAMTLLATLSQLGLNIALIRFLPKSDRNTDMINSCLTISGIISLILATIAIASVNIWSPAFGFIISDNPFFAVAFIVFTVFWALSMMIDYVFIAKRKTFYTLLKNTLISLFKLALPFVMVYFFKAFGIVSSWGVAGIIVVIISLFIFLTRVQRDYRPIPKLNSGILKELRQYSAGNYFANLFSTLPSFVLPVMIVNILGAEQNAYFYMAWMIGNILFFIPGAVSQSLFAEGSHFEEELERNVRRSCKFIYILLIPAIIVLLCSAKWLLMAFGDNYSENGVALLQILALSGIFIGINSVYYTILRVQGRIKELILIFVFAAIIVLTGSYFAIQNSGVIATGYVWLGVQGFISLYVIIAMRKYTKIKNLTNRIRI